MNFPMKKKLKKALMIYMFMSLLMFIGFAGRNCVNSNGENSAYEIGTALWAAAICRFGSNRFGDECRYF